MLVETALVPASAVSISGVSIMGLVLLVVLGFLGSALTVIFAIAIVIVIYLAQIAGRMNKLLQKIDDLHLKLEGIREKE